MGGYPKLVILMNKLGLNHHNLEYPILRQTLLDPWNRHPGGITDGQLRFIDGILRCKGPARAIDQVAMQAEAGLVIEPSQMQTNILKNGKEQFSAAHSAVSQHSLNSFHSDLSSVSFVSLVYSVAVAWTNRVAQWGSGS